MISSRLAVGTRVSRGLGRAATRRSAAARLARDKNPWAATSTVLRGRIPAVFYTTERVLELRTGKKKEFQPKTMYTPSRETENCGVGLIASLKSIPSRKIVEDADEMLVRMSHRGGCGCDPNSGDGAGKLGPSSPLQSFVFIEANFKGVGTSPILFQIYYSIPNSSTMMKPVHL